MIKTYDAIVIGLGGVGSAAVKHLAADGYRVLGIDQFSPPHALGSSHGQTRIIRKAYFEHPDYVPLLIRAYELWRQLERDVEERLYFQTGLLQVGPTDGSVLSGVQASAEKHRLPIESMSMDDAIQRFPGIQGNREWSAILEVDAGYLKVEACVAAHLKLALACGAELRMDLPVRSWSCVGHDVQVVTDDDTFQAARLIIAAGPWASQCLSQYHLPLRVLRKHLYWYPAPEKYQQVHGFPCFFFDTAQGYFYGFPSGADAQTEFHGLKVARHSGGCEIAGPDGQPHPEAPDDRLAVEKFLSECLPSVLRPLSAWQGCYYTLTPDEHFIVDRLIDANQVVLVAGLSGHGFKFTSVLGEIAAKLVMDERLAYDIQFLSLTRQV